MSDRNLIPFLKRQGGMDRATEEALEARLSKLEDWYRFCKQCGRKIIGTREQVQRPCGCDGKSG